MLPKILLHTRALQRLPCTLESWLWNMDKKRVSFNSLNSPRSIPKICSYVFIKLLFMHVNRLFDYQYHIDT